MKINKEYRKGGFFGNSQDKFSDMEGAGSGINTAFNQWVLKNQGFSFEKREALPQKAGETGEAKRRRAHAVLIAWST